MAYLGMGAVTPEQLAQAKLQAALRATAAAQRGQELVRTGGATPGLAADHGTPRAAPGVNGGEKPASMLPKLLLIGGAVGMLALIWMRRKKS